jgi:hypothetical protein
MQSATPQEPSERHRTDLWGNISCCRGANGFAVFQAIKVLGGHDDCFPKPERFLDEKISFLN